jgi:hypothetical protein
LRVGSYTNLSHARLRMPWGGPSACGGWPIRLAGGFIHKSVTRPPSDALGWPIRLRWVAHPPCGWVHTQIWHTPAFGCLGVPHRLRRVAHPPCGWVWTAARRSLVGKTRRPIWYLVGRYLVAHPFRVGSIIHVLSHPSASGGSPFMVGHIVHGRVPHRLRWVRTARGLAFPVSARHIVLVSIN